MEINEVEDCDKAAEMVGFPMIVKPQMGAGSAGMNDTMLFNDSPFPTTPRTTLTIGWSKFYNTGVYRATSVEDLKERVKLILSEVKESWDLQWNPGLANVAPAMVEQFLEGDEFDVDLLFWYVLCRLYMNKWSSVGVV